MKNREFQPSIWLALYVPLQQLPAQSAAWPSGPCRRLIAPWAQEPELQAAWSMPMCGALGFQVDLHCMQQAKPAMLLLVVR
jgi:hypothetical protein